MPKARVLVVEEEGIIARDILSSLQELGYEVCSTAKTGEEAIRKAEAEQPDLALVDVVLKGPMNGIDAARLIHSRFKIPIICLTGYADEEMPDRARVTEPFGYLIKPFHEKELDSTIEMALFRHGLRRSPGEPQEWLSVMLDSIADALIATDEKGSVKFMNPVAESLSGWTSAEAKGRPLEAVFNIGRCRGKTQPVSLADELAAGADNTARCHHSLLKSKGASPVDVEFKAAPIRDSQGNIAGLVLVFRDITEQKKAEERLRLLSQAIEQSSEGLAVTDLNGTLMFVNKAFAAMHGCVPEQMTRNGLAGFHSPSQAGCVCQAFRLVQRRGKHSAEIQHTRGDGVVVPVLMHSSILLDGENNAKGIIVTLRDISDTKAAEEAS